MIRLIATDLDGTLLRSDGTIGERTLQVFADARRSGITIVAATGRGPAALPDLGSSGVIELAVCSNGAVLVDLATGEVLERNDLQGPDVEQIFADIRQHVPDVLFAWERGDAFGYDAGFAEFGQILIDSYSVLKSVDFDAVADVAKAFVATPHLGYEELAARVKDVISVDAEVSSAGLPFVVITAPNVTKASTLDRLCQRKGIQPSEVVAFGDSWNDLAMLHWAGLGVAMQNANEDVQRVADAVAGSHEHDGVAEFLAEMLR